MSVYVLGAGAMGTLISASLAKQFKVNFIIRNAAKIDNLAKTGNMFSITRLFDNNTTTQYTINGAFQADKIPDNHIDFLLISVKTFDTVKSLAPLLDKISEKTRILLVQNGMGVVDELYNEVWTDISKRPTIYQGVISHGAWQSAENHNTYNYNHAGFGYLKVCKVPRDLKSTKTLKEDEAFMKNDAVMDALFKSDIAGTGYSYDVLLVYQIQKFLVNCCMNATTSIVDAINYKISEIPETHDLFTGIVDEGLTVLFKAYPALAKSELAQSLLTTEKQVEFVKHIGFGVNPKNSTSMRQDVLNLRDTEIDYINGHIIKKAKECGLTAPINSTIRQLLKMKQAVTRINSAEAENN